MLLYETRFAHHPHRPTAPMSFSTPQPFKTLEVLLHRMTDRIRQSIELSEILDTTVDEMRRFLSTDRFKVYRFHEDGSGEVVAESIQEERLPSLLAHRFPAEDIPAHAREMFLRARQRTIVNVAKREIGISCLLCHTTQTPVSTHLWSRAVDPCHVEYLTAMGVQSSLVVPILQQKQLWGLLVAHHSTPRRFGLKELELVQLIANQVSVAIAHANLLNLTRSQGRHEAIINKVASLLHSTTNASLQNALDHTVKVLQCGGGRLYLPTNVPGTPTQLITSGIQPKPIDAIPSAPSVSERSGAKKHKAAKTPKPALVVLEQRPDWQAWLKTEASNQLFIDLWAIANLRPTQPPSAILSALIQSNIRGMLVVKLTHRNRFLGYLSLFRQPKDLERIWAGRPDASDPRQHRPRQSFDTWRELKRNQTPPWTPQDIKLVQELADRFSSVIHQTQLYQKVQALNVDLEHRVLQRTAELQHLNQHLRQEITDRERAFKELEKARDSLKRLSHQNELILNSAGDGIYGIDPEGQIVFVNRATTRLLDYPKEKLIGQFMHDLLSYSRPDGRPYPWEQSAVFKTLQNGQTHHVTGELIERQDGFRFPVEYVSTPIYEKEKIIGAVVTFKDITERQLMEQMKDEFIAVVSHELRTPLTSIRTALGLLAEDDLDIPVAKRQRMVKIASSNTNRLVRLVNDILDVERIKLGKITLNKENCDLANIMIQAGDEMQAMAENHEIDLAIQPYAAQLWADPDRIIQTLTNLLSNAIKFSPPHSTVEIKAQTFNHKNLSTSKKYISKKAIVMIKDRLELSENVVLIQVNDQGNGIPHDQLETIFGQFKQLDSSDSSHQGGTGLGLAICRSIIQQHDGRIWAESTVGVGSTFFFTLPCQ